MIAPRPRPATWIVTVRAPDGTLKRSRVTSVVVDQEPTHAQIRATVGQAARLLVDDLFGLQGPIRLHRPAGSADEEE